MSRFSDLGLLVLRLSFAAPMLILHGWPKLENFSSMSEKFMDPIGLGAQVSFALVVFAEFFCSIAVATGFLTRLAAFPPAFAMAVVVFVVKSNASFGEKELPFLLMMGFITLMLTGGGSYSIDRFFRPRS